MASGKTVWHFCVQGVIIYIAVLAILYLFQRNILYRPTHVYVTPAEAYAPRELHELAVTTQDGIALKGWYAPATTKPYTLVFFHGNGDSLRTAAGVAEPYILAGYGFLLTEYRGYSGMKGSPSEQGLYDDARAYIKNLIASGVKPQNIILFGHSLGTGVATQMATEFPVGGVILMSPYLSIVKMAQLRFPVFPASLIVKDRFESFKKIDAIHAPLLITHGENDFVVPFSQGQQLFALANEPKTFIPFPNGGHVDIFDQFIGPSLNWLAKLSPTLPAAK
jgi:fermentation-respiration switch protein FrsA (DUF1100 family)